MKREFEHNSPAPIEVKYVSLPTSRQIANAISPSPEGASTVHAYQRQVERIQQAQSKMAFIATKVFRPEVYHEMMDVRRQLELEQANECLKHFSETCTQNFD